MGKAKNGHWQLYSTRQFHIKQCCCGSGKLTSHDLPGHSEIHQGLGPYGPGCSYATEDCYRLQMKAMFLNHTYGSFSRWWFSCQHQSFQIGTIKFHGSQICGFQQHSDCHQLQHGVVVCYHTYGCFPKFCCQYWPFQPGTIIHHRCGSHVLQQHYTGISSNAIVNAIAPSDAISCQICCHSLTQLWSLACMW